MPRWLPPRLTRLTMPIRSYVFCHSSFAFTIIIQSAHLISLHIQSSQLYTIIYNHIITNPNNNNNNNAAHSQLGLARRYLFPFPSCSSHSLPLRPRLSPFHRRGRPLPERSPHHRREGRSCSHWQDYSCSGRSDGAYDDDGGRREGEGEGGDGGRE